MVSEAFTKIKRVGPRHTVYLRKDIVEDTNFPFKVDDKLVVEIRNDHLVIRKPVRSRAQNGHR
jgi:hypothetical protein